MSRLLRIMLAAERGQPLQDRSAVQAIAGQGLAGDRYALGRGTFSDRFEVRPGARELSLIDVAAVALANQRMGTSLDAGAFRRNLLVDGLDLPQCLKQRFRIGEVVIEVLGRCPPCPYLARLLGVDAERGLKGLGGVRARIVESGVLRVGEAIEEIDLRG